MKYLAVLSLMTLFACQPSQKGEKEASPDRPQATDEEGWIVLFDGTHLDQWHGYNMGAEMFPEWSIEDSVLKFTPGEVGGKNIVTNRNFNSFVLSLEWKISEGGNSGIFWGVFEDSVYNEAYQTGPEIQVLDNERHPDAQANPKFHQAGALYDLVQPAVDVCKPAGEWNHVLLTVDHFSNRGSVDLNGTRIVDFEPHGPKWDSLVAGSKFADWEGFGIYQTGKIGLQDHSDVVYYRDIKVKEILE